MQIYMVTWEGQSGTPDCFRNFSDIEQSIRISYGQAKDLKIEKSPTSGPTRFKVSGTWVDGEVFEMLLVVTRYPVWDSPTHL